MAQLQADLAGHGATWFAHYQSAGKGQRGKTWVSEAGQNIMMSIALDTKGLPLANQFALSMAVALSCRQLFDFYSNGETCIKWPNDIYWRDRKAGGILIENWVNGSKWLYAVVGIGLNINQLVFPEAPNKAVSLLQITGKKHDPVELARLLCTLINQRWQQLITGVAHNLHAAYQQHLFKKDKEVVLKTKGQVLQAKILGVSTTGGLNILSPDGPMTLVSGEVEWILPNQ